MSLKWKLFFELTLVEKNIFDLMTILWNTLVSLKCQIFFELTFVEKNIFDLTSILRNTLVSLKWKLFCGTLLLRRISLVSHEKVD